MVNSEGDDEMAQVVESCYERDSSEVKNDLSNQRGTFSHSICAICSLVAFNAQEFTLTLIFRDPGLGPSHISGIQICIPRQYNFHAGLFLVHSPLLWKSFRSLGNMIKLSEN